MKSDLEYIFWGRFGIRIQLILAIAVITVASFTLFCLFCIISICRIAEIATWIIFALIE